MRSEKERRKLFDKIYKKRKWIIEGVYASWIDEGIKRADTVIILDINVRKLLWRITRRSIIRKKSKENQSLNSYFGLIKSVLRYKNKNHLTGYYKHKEMIKKHKVNFIIIKNEKQINDFLKKIK